MMVERTEGVLKLSLLPSVVCFPTAHRHRPVSREKKVNMTSTLSPKGMRRARWAALAIAGLTALGITACTGDGAPPGEEPHIGGEANLQLPDLSSVQALGLASLFLDYGGPRFNLDEAWFYMTIAVKSAHAIGLHRESPAWGFDEKTLQRRRSVFWELFNYDSMMVGWIFFRKEFHLICFTAEFGLWQTAIHPYIPW